MLVWVRRGSARARTATTALTAVAGEVLYLPAGSERRVKLDPDARALPLRFPVTQHEAAPLQPLRFAIDSQDELWLLREYMHAIGVLGGPGASITRISKHLQQLSPHGIVTPPMPRTDALTRAARRLAAPQTPCSLAEVAAGEHLTERTMRRGFEAETGYSPARWRTRTRLASACAARRANDTLQSIAHASGYRSTSAFQRALLREFGVTTQELGAAHQAETGSAVPPPIRLWPRVIGFNVLFTVLIGSATFTVDGERTAVTAPHTQWLAAGSLIDITVDAGSIAIPIGWLPGGIVPPQAHGRAVLTTDPDALLHSSARHYAGLEPAGQDAPSPQDTLASLIGQPFPAAGCGEGDAVERAARKLAARIQRDPASAPQLSEFARSAGASPGELASVFVTITGVRPSDWLLRCRMAHARVRLAHGTGVNDTAEALGYSTAAAFVRAFTRLHGISPGRYARGIRAGAGDAARTRGPAVR